MKKGIILLAAIIFISGCHAGPETYDEHLARLEEKPILQEGAFTTTIISSTGNNSWNMAVQRFPDKFFPEFPEERKFCRKSGHQAIL